MISHVDIIGALVYRTRQALNKLQEGKTNTDFFVNAASKYKYYKAVFDTPNVMHLWHYAGTENEIREAFEVIGKDGQAASKLFPCIINYQNVVETHGVGPDGLVQLDYDLAIVCLVDQKWTTEQRNRNAHEPILEPIYDEFMRQVRKCGWFQFPMEGMDFRRMKVFTTGSSMHRALSANFGWYVDLISIVDLRPHLKPTLCDVTIEMIKREAELVTENIIKTV